MAQHLQVRCWWTKWRQEERGGRRGHASCYVGGAVNTANVGVHIMHLTLLRLPPVCVSPLTHHVATHTSRCHSMTLSRCCPPVCLRICLDLPHTHIYDQAAKEVLRDSVLPSLTDASVQHSLLGGSGSSSGLDTQLLGFETGGERAEDRKREQEQGRLLCLLWGAKFQLWRQFFGVSNTLRAPSFLPDTLIPSPAAPQPCPSLCVRVCTTDAEVDKLATVLRLLYIRDLRQLQTAIDRMVVDVQVCLCVWTVCPVFSDVVGCRVCCPGNLNCVLVGALTSQPSVISHCSA